MGVIRVLLVDDSLFIRKRIADLINSDRELEVVACAGDGVEAIKQIIACKPDVVVLDLQMPKMDGLTCLGYIMSEYPTPTVILSAHAERGSETTMQALEFGAVDFVFKPSGEGSKDIIRVKEELITKIKISARVGIEKVKLLMREAIPRVKKPLLPVPLNYLVTIGASTGGPRALGEIIPKIDADVPAGFLIVQHMPEKATQWMAEHLDKQSHIRVKEAEDGEPIESGKALIAPGDLHMVVVQSAGKERIALRSDPKLHSVRPSVDITMKSVAPIYQGKGIGVILTGMGDDGALGMAEIKKYGGKTIAEDESTCVVYGMPKAAIEKGVVDKVVPLHNVAGKIVEMLGGGKTSPQRAQRKTLTF